jgi:malonate-semialdehyde dehydrogenase (acetylating) / methylmalonate-semialdehyde dehydrogenase
LQQAQASAEETSAAAAAPRLRNYIAGAWRPARAPESLDDVDPATGGLAALVPLSGAADLDAAVEAARAAQPGWRALGPQRRARALIELRAALSSRREEIAALVTADMGKTIADARGEVGRGIESVEAAIAAPHLLKGENLEGVADGVDVELVRQPVGVVAAITPFNFPAMIPLWFLPFAIAAGNCFILKPSERDPRPAELIFKLVDSVTSIPAGVCNLVHGARDAVDAILDHPGIDAVSFVGQAATARYVAERATAAGKRVQALGGAKNSLVVMPDAELEATVAGIMSSAFGAAGQRCLAGSVAVLVGDRARQDKVRDALAAAATRLRVGPGAEEGTDVCPLVSPEARERLLDAIGRAVGDGGEIVLDGRDGDAGPAATMLAPTIVESADRESELAREELFGPLLTLVRADDLDDAIEFVNGSRYGNAGSIFTASGDAARRYRFGIEAGMLGVNVGVAAPVAWFPFSGWKDSMAGDLHANGRDAIDFYTRKKVVTSRWR